MPNKRLSILCLATSAGFGALLFCLILFSVQPTDAYNQGSAEFAGLMALANENESVRVIVQLNVPVEPLDEFDSPQAVEQHLSQIQSAQDSVLSGIAEDDVRVTADLETIPFLGLEVSADGLAALQSSSDVINIIEDIPVPHALDSSGDVIGRPAATAHGLTGEGVAIAILDTGVDITHDAFKDQFGNSRIVSEACYSSNSLAYNAVTVCPDGSEESIAAGSGDDCQVAAIGFSDAQDDCEHGTHVAGIAAGGDVNAGIFGVAPEADIIAIQVFSLFQDGVVCGSQANCTLSFTSDQLLALERVYELRNTFNIASVNMSLGGGSYATYCDSDSRKAIIDNLAAAGIATIIAAGNDGYTSTVGAPSCISSAITVGSTNDDDTIASYSNIGPQIDLLAPGTSIFAAIPGNDYGTKSGTSMATPQVAGAWALLKQIDPNGTVSAHQSAFSTSSTLLDDARTDGVFTFMPRINLLEAANDLAPGLQTDISFSNGTFLPGDLITATITISNNLDFNADDLVVTGLLEDNFIFSPSSLSGDGSYSTIGDQTVITWTTGSGLASDSAISRIITGFVKSDLSAGGYISATFGTMGSNLSRTGAVHANSVINAINQCGFTESFEDGNLGFEWSTETTNTGRVRVTSNRSSDGSYGLVIDDAVSDSDVSDFRAVLTFDLEGAENINLSFDWSDLGDEYGALYDGVFIRSTPADSWVKIFDFAGDSNDDVFNDATIDISAEATSAGVALTSKFQLAFSGNDNFSANFDNPGGGDGYVIDNIALSCNYTLEPLALSGTASESNPEVGEEFEVTFDVNNLADSNQTGLTISATIPREASVVNTVLIFGGSGISTESLPLLVEDGTLSANETMSITIPLTIAEGTSAGESLNITLEVSGDKLTETQRISVPFTVKNSAPTVSNETVFPTESGPLTFNVVANDSDINGDGLIVSAIGLPGYGTATFISQTISYTPTDSFKGGDVLTYTVSDQNGGLGTGLMTIIVPNSAPKATNDVVTTTLGSTIVINPLTNDSDPNFDTLVLESISSPSAGEARISGDSVIFTATGATPTTAVFNYTASDQDGGIADGTISVVITQPEDDEPVEEPIEDPIEEPDDGTEFEVDPTSPVPQTFNGADGKISLDIPVGSLPGESKTLLMESRQSPSAALPTAGAGLYFDLNLSDTNGSLLDQPTFDPPLQLSIAYNEALLNGVPEENLQLYFYDTVQNKWMAIPIVNRDLEQNIITAELEHFTEFALADQYTVYLPMIQR